ncbi:hypothetical protein [Streptomyces sp. NPDC055107]
MSLEPRSELRSLRRTILAHGPALTSEELPKPAERALRYGVEPGVEPRTEARVEPRTEPRVETPPNR